MRKFGLWLAVLGLVAMPADAAPLLRRGVGLHEWLNWSPIAADGSYRWPPYRSVDEWLAGSRPLADWPPGDQFSRIAAMGFDFVRLTVDPGPLLASTGPRRAEGLAVLRDDIAKVRAPGLTVVVNLHAVSQVPAYGMDRVNGGAGTPGIAEYIAMTADVAEMLDEMGQGVVFEPYNEPAYYPCDASGSEDWQTIMAETVATIRTVAPSLPIVVTGACGGSITGLTDLDPAFDDPNLLYSFHMYEPHLFSHQRADEPKDFASGLPWPARAGTPEAVVEALGMTGE